MLNIDDVTGFKGSVRHSRTKAYAGWYKCVYSDGDVAARKEPNQTSRMMKRIRADDILLADDLVEGINKKGKPMYGTSTEPDPTYYSCRLCPTLPQYTRMQSLLH